MKVKHYNLWPEVVMELNQVGAVYCQCGSLFDKIHNVHSINRPNDINYVSSNEIE